VWADLADDTDAESFYEDTHVPNVVAKLGITARNAEVAADNIFKEVSNIEGKYLTLYDVPSSTAPAEIDAQIQLDPLKVPKTTKFEARIYDEYAAWLGEEWPGRKLALFTTYPCALTNMRRPPRRPNVHNCPLATRCSRPRRIR
jgi:hypothetical protein